MLCGARGFCFLPSLSEGLLAGERFRVFGDRPLAEVSMRGAYGAGAVIKRIFDFTCAALLILATSPLLLAAALLVLATNGRPSSCGRTASVSMAGASECGSCAPCTSATLCTALPKATSV
jgi:hypothetical protein